MSTETLSFWLLGPEKNRFQNFNLASKINNDQMSYFLSFFPSQGHKSSIFGQNQHPGSFSESTDQGLSFGTKIYAKHAKLLKIWAPNVWLKLYLYLLCFCQDFIGQVKILKPVFLRYQESKWQSFSAHQKENFM